MAATSGRGGGATVGLGGGASSRPGASGLACATWLCSGGLAACGTGSGAGCGAALGVNSAFGARSGGAGARSAGSCRVDCGSGADCGGARLVVEPASCAGAGTAPVSGVSEAGCGAAMRGARLGPPQVLTSWSRLSCLGPKPEVAQQVRLRSDPSRASACRGGSPERSSRQPARALRGPQSRRSAGCFGGVAGDGAGPVRPALARAPRPFRSRPQGQRCPASLDERLAVDHS